MLSNKKEEFSIIFIFFFKHGTQMWARYHKYGEGALRQKAQSESFFVGAIELLTRFIVIVLKEVNLFLSSYLRPKQH